MANTIRIKRRVASGSSGAPSSLKNGELAYNEADNKLYYGFGDNGSGVATSIPPIAGPGVLGDYVTIGTAQTITGTKSFTPVVNANGGISTTSGNLVLDSTGGTIDINDNVDISGTLVVGSTLNGHTIPGGTGTFALTSDTLATHSGHSYIDIVGQDIVAGDVALGSHTSGNYVGTLSPAAGNPGITVAGSGGEGTSATVAVDSTVIRTTGVQNIGGIKTFTSLVNANAGIAVDTNKFTVADATGNTLIAGTLGVTGDTSLGTVSAGTWAATDVAVLHGGTGASTAAAARTNLVVDIAGTDNSTDVTLIAGTGYLSLSGQEITAGVVALTTHTSGSYVASLNEGTGVTITDNVGAEGATPTIAIGQPVATTDDVTFDNITATGYLRGPAIFTIDPATHGNDTGKVVIAGNLQVDGITTTINSTTVAIDDKNLRLADTASTSSVLNGAGIELGYDPNSPTALASGALVDFLYVHADSRMLLSSAMKITGNLQDTTLADCIIDGGTF